MISINTIARSCIYGSLAVFAFSASPVFAQAEDATPSMKIEIGDLNPATSRGMEQINRRVLLAARKVCEVQSNTRDLQEIANQRNCVNHAVASAQPQIVALGTTKGQITNVAVTSPVREAPGSSGR